MVTNSNGNVSSAASAASDGEGSTSDGGPIKPLEIRAKIIRTYGTKHNDDKIPNLMDTGDLNYVAESDLRSCGLCPSRAGQILEEESIEDFYNFFE